MSRQNALLAVLVAASLLAAASYAAALSCPRTLAEVAEIELIDVTVDGKPVAKPTGYDLASVRVWRRWDDMVLLEVNDDREWYWSEEHEPVP